TALGCWLLGLLQGKERKTKLFLNGWRRGELHSQIVSAELWREAASGGKYAQGDLTLDTSVNRILIFSKHSFFNDELASDQAPAQNHIVESDFGNRDWEDRFTHRQIDGAGGEIKLFHSNQIFAFGRFLKIRRILNIRFDRRTTRNV